MEPRQSTRLRVGLAGGGVMGRSLGAALRRLETAELVGIADPDEAAREQAGQELDAASWASVEVLLDEQSPDVLVIAAPPHRHRALVELAAQRGVHVFVEKPMAPSTADCDAMISAAESAGVLLMVGQVLRFYPCWRRILELRDEGLLGELRTAVITRMGGPWGELARSWRFSREESGGLLMEVNAHEIDFLCRLFGPPDQVYATATGSGAWPAGSSSYLLSLHFPTDAAAVLHSSNASSMSRIEGVIEGAKGTLHYEGGFGEGAIRLRDFEGAGHEVAIRDLQYEDPVQHELRLFIDALLTGGESPVPGGEGRLNVAIAEAAYRSIESGEPVRL